jgi:CxxC motif-containing protein (DUF1111 family)
VSYPRRLNPCTSALAFAALLGGAAAYGCSSGPSVPSDAPPVTTGADAGATSAALTGVNLPSEARLDEAFAEATPDEITAFDKGDHQFDGDFFPADGLGPVFVDVGCGQCHGNGLRGAGVDRRMVAVMSDGYTTAPDQSMFPYGFEERPQVTAGATIPVLPPDAGLFPAGESVRVTLRNPPAIIGRGYMEAVLDSEILRVQAEQAQRTDGIHGHVNMVAYSSATVADPAYGTIAQGQMVIGRFGLKARIPTLDDFAADALQNDMGITSPLRPNEIPNPDGLTDDAKPGVDTTAAVVNTFATYMRLTAIPTRAMPAGNGQQLFDQALCSVCHVPSLHTRSDYPIAELANIDAPVYTDMLVHDVGTALADGMVDGMATSTQFRTAPLIGLRFQKTFLNDASAHSVQDAIAAHAGEAAGAAQAFAALSSTDQATLVAWVEAL